MRTLDFRSDTVTQPTPQMRDAMANAPVGDDVYGDDPTMNELQAYAAELTGMEAAIYMCSGTMGNLVAILSHCSRGDGILMGAASHIWKNEAGNVAGVAGVMPYPLDDASGIPTPESIRASYQPTGNVHYANTTLTVLENTHNAAGGVPIDVETFTRTAEIAHDMGMRVHVDGARIFDAVAYFGADIKDYTAPVDSMQICLSKGLCAPMGSLLCGGRDFIERARKFRKFVGGGQRQSGIAAAAGLIALRDMRERLSSDHANAALLAEVLAEAGVDVEQIPRRTNMVYFKTPANLPDASAFAERCKERGLLLGAAGPARIRMVTHYGLDEGSVREAALVIKEVAGR